MPCRTARRLCPAAIFLLPRFEVYREVSRQLHEEFLDLTPLVEPIALDEAYLDITTLVDRHQEADGAARGLKRRILEETSLSASIGVASNKLVAKVASERQKPDGLTIVLAGEERDFLATLPVRSLLGIGPQSEKRLLAVGITHVSQLAAADSGWLVARLGQTGLEWQRLAQGIDDRPVEPGRELKQASRERTFPRDVAGKEELRGILEGLVADLMPALHSAPPARTFTLKLRYADWTTVTRRTTPGTIVTSEVLARLVPQLFEESWDGRPLRLMGLGVSNFIPAPTGQLPLFDSSSA
jgi:DNA polymerase-4